MSWSLFSSVKNGGIIDIYLKVNSEVLWDMGQFKSTSYLVSTSEECLVATEGIFYNTRIFFVQVEQYIYEFPRLLHMKKTFKSQGQLYTWKR